MSKKNITLEPIEIKELERPTDFSAFQLKLASPKIGRAHV